MAGAPVLRSFCGCPLHGAQILPADAGPYFGKIAGQLTLFCVISLSGRRRVEKSVLVTPIDGVFFHLPLSRTSMVSFTRLTVFYSPLLVSF